MMPKRIQLSTLLLINLFEQNRQHPLLYWSPASDQESITVEWQSPNPPEGRIIRYYVIYWETAEDDTTFTNDSIECTNGICDDLEYRFSYTIANLKADTNYSIQVGQSPTNYSIIFVVLARILSLPV